MKDTFTKYKTILSLQVDKEKINVIFPAAFINIYKVSIREYFKINMYVGMEK